MGKAGDVIFVSKREDSTSYISSSSPSPVHPSCHSMQKAFCKSPTLLPPAPALPCPARVGAYRLSSALLSVRTRVIRIQSNGLRLRCVRAWCHCFLLVAAVVPACYSVQWHGRMVHSAGVHAGPHLRMACPGEWQNDKPLLSSEEHGEQFFWFHDARLYREDPPPGDDMWAGEWSEWLRSS